MEFYQVDLSLENYRSSIILFGRNFASYKFTLPKISLMYLLMKKYVNREMMYVQPNRSRNPIKVYCANSLLEKSLYLEILSDKASK